MYKVKFGFLGMIRKIHARGSGSSFTKPVEHDILPSLFFTTHFFFIKNRYNSNILSKNERK